jgi:PAS domain S-box-containing protein
MLDNVSTLNESVVDALDVGILVLDCDHGIVGWNDWIERLSGLSRHAVLGKNFYDVFPALKHGRLPAVIDDALQSGTSSILTHSLNLLLPLHREDGQPVLQNIVVRPIAFGCSTRCLLQITDVTIAVTRERVLRERQNAKYHAIADSAPDAIITINLDQSIQWINGAAEKVFGYASSELIGRKLHTLIDQGDELSEALADEATPEQRVFQVIGRQKGGGTGFFEVSFGRWKADDRVFVTTIWRDVTDRIAAETALRDARDSLLKSNEELEARVVERTREREVALAQLYESQKMETIGQLTGGVAHDFNNLLFVILGSLTLLKKGIPDDPRTLRLLDGAIQGAERGATLTKRLLAFARRQELKPEAVEVQTLIPNIRDFLQRSVGPEIAIRIDIANDLPSVRIDANQLELALMNLAVNSRDAMPGGGLMTIACRNATSDELSRLALTAGEGYVYIAVTDTGEGMDDATLAKSMEPFFTTKGIGKGTGLGLSMVHGLAAQSGGATEIKSELGKGTTVAIWLPQARNDDAPHGAPANDDLKLPNTARRLKVLLVDDDLLVSTNTAYMLADLGHDVLEASTAAQALQHLGSEPHVDLVITDYAMPRMNGFDLALEIERSKPGIPIVIATGYAELPMQAMPLRFPRLAKPYTQQDLQDILATAVRDTDPSR